MMKRKFGDSLRSKTDIAMVNETFCKIPCHNLVVLIHETRELEGDEVEMAGSVAAFEVFGHWARKVKSVPPFAEAAKEGAPT
jgi:hypothetical protein